MTEPTVETQPDAVTKASADLRAIERLALDLPEQAANSSNSRLMPGGAAMALLANHASLEAWENQQETTERTGIPYTSAEDEDPEEHWDSYQLLRFWSEALRLRFDEEEYLTPTLRGEAQYLDLRLDWAWKHEPHFDDMAKDIRKARVKLEEILSDGVRTERGVPCFDCNVDLVRPSRPRREPHHCEGHDGVCFVPHEVCPHDRGGLVDEWVCPSCDRRYGVEDYRRAVSHAHFVHAEYLTLSDCVDRTGAPRGSIQGWASKGLVDKRKDPETGRVTYCVADIETRIADKVA